MPVPRRLALLLPLSACAQGVTASLPAEQAVTLPPAGLPQGAGDPTRGAILASSYAFGTPGVLAGNPAAAAEALAQLEYLTVELGLGGPWRDMDPLVPLELRQARAEARAALGLRADATPQLAVDALYGTATALRGAGPDAARQAIAPLAQPGTAPAVLARLSDLPPLPRAAAATARARSALNRRDSDRRPPYFRF
ncbi:hypothetical protein [Falsiroseomonas selenitidurans]|uniref:Uncharacterized protein n=1 Tax=Falsiroseomonas selenitidurans TaxID=2716335 RepID=A0ABX1E0V3_9PROT|nr:hypothetical protein [Falsiroseomonas selenitidurans]NKC29382.1 hypothetical protein [Falsiroseomonas selenitidurans]